MENIKTVEEILNVIEEIGDEFPNNVSMKIEFSDIENEDDIRKLSRQEWKKTNLFEASPSIPYLWMVWNVSKRFEVVVKGKKVDYVVG